MSATPAKHGADTVVRKLWHYCNVLRNDGLSYPDYVEQLTYLLFLKMADEREVVEIPARYAWSSLVALEARALYDHYNEILSKLGKREGVLGVIFRNARNKIKDPKKLRYLVVELIGGLRWTELAADVKGDAYEGLLEKNAQDTKSGAGQYFTPRPLIDAIVDCVRPGANELVCDPACGTGGFLLGAHEFIRRHSRAKGRGGIRGSELVEEVARLATMNLLLHGIGANGGKATFPITCEDSLANPPDVHADVVLTNPPFGIKGSIKEGSTPEGANAEPVRNDFWVRTANKQLNFLQHIHSLLAPGGRAAVVLPDNVLYERGVGATVRRELLLQCTVHTILRLPRGLFYAQGVTANVLFFDKKAPTSTKGGKLWIYNLRAEKRYSRKKRPLERRDLDDFVRQYRPGVETERRETAHFRAFLIEEILRDPACRLDFDWQSRAAPPSQQPASAKQRLEVLTKSISRDLQSALQALNRVTDGRK